MSVDVDRARLELRKLVGFARAYPHLGLLGVRFQGTPMFFGRRPIVVTGGNIRIGPAFRSQGKQIAPMFGAVAGGRLVLGANVYLNQGANVVASAEIVIGDNVRLADLATVYDASHHALDATTPSASAPVHIGSEVWIGRNALILPGVQIGDGAVIAAGAVVSHDVAPRTLVAGVPARLVRELEVPPGWTRP